MAVAVALAGVLAGGVALQQLRGPGGEPLPALPGVAAASTAAVQGTPLARIALAGDVGTGDGAERRTARAVEDRARAGAWDALVLLGDNVYDDGDPDQVDRVVLRPFAPVLRDAPLLAALGNHDVRGGHGPAQLRALGQPGPWYSRRIGPLLIVVLDSNRPSDPQQLAWLRNTLSQDDAPWTVAVMHHPMRSAGQHGSSPDVRAAFAPLFRTYGVQLAIAGHDHDYERTRSIDGTTYLVSGAGAKLRPVGSNADTVVSSSVLHFLDLRAYDDRLVVQAVGQRGDVLDGVVLRNAGRQAG